MSKFQVWNTNSEWMDGWREREREKYILVLQMRVLYSFSIYAHAVPLWRALSFSQWQSSSCSGFSIKGLFEIGKPFVLLFALNVFKSVSSTWMVHANTHTQTEYGKGIKKNRKAIEKLSVSFIANEHLDFILCLTPFVWKHTMGIIIICFISIWCLLTLSHDGTADDLTAMLNPLNVFDTSLLFRFVFPH